MATQQHTIDWESELLDHREWMVGLARRRVGESHAAEDVVQEVGLSVIKQNPVLDDATNIRAWLYQAVVRRAADYLRGRYRRERVNDVLSQSNDIEQRDDGLDWVLASEQQKQLGNALEKLPEDDQELLRLKFTLNWTYQQLSEHFEIGERAVEYKLVCAKRRIRAEMQRSSGDEDV